MVNLRRKLAILPMAACVCWAVALIARIFSPWPLGMQGLEAVTATMLVVGLLISCAARLRQHVMGHAIPDSAGISLVTAAVVFLALHQAWAMTAPSAAFERASGRMAKTVNFGVLFGVLPGPARLRLFCIVAITAATEVHSAQAYRVLGLEPPAVAPESVVSFLTTCTVSYLSTAALDLASQFENAMGDLRQMVDARSLAASRPVDARVDHAWREGPLVKIHLASAQVHDTVSPSPGPCHCAPVTVPLSLCPCHCARITLPLSLCPRWVGLHTPNQDKGG
jgi:hypothetical protein